MARVVPIQSVAYGELSRFCAEFPDDGWTPEQWLRRFRFWWEGNPSFSSDWTRGWTLVDKDQIVGMLADIPTRVRILNRDQVVGNLSTWRVQPHYQGESLRLLSAALSESRDRPVFNTTPTLDVASVLRGFRFRNLIETMDEHLYICRAGFLAWRLKDKRAIPLPVGLPLGVAWRAYQGLRFRFQKRRERNAFSVRVLDQVGPEFDDLWRRTQNYFGFTNARRAVDLHWLVTRNPVRAPVLIGCFDSAERLVGFALFIRQTLDRPAGATQFVCLDLWCEGSAERPFAALIREGVRQAERLGVSLVRIPHYHEVVRRAAVRAGLRVVRHHPATLYCRLPRWIALGIAEEGSRLSGYFGDVAL